MSIPDLENLSLAFRLYDLHALKRARLLFKTIAHPGLVKLGSVLVRLALTLRFPMAWILKPTVFKQFCGGQRLEDCENSIARLHSCNIASIPDYSVEGTPDEHSMDQVFEEVSKVIRQAASDQRIAFAVFKPSGLIRSELLAKQSCKDALSEQEKLEWQRGAGRFENLCSQAYALKVQLLVDAEESWLQPAIDTLVLEMMKLFNKEVPTLFNTLQMYRLDAMDRLRIMCESADKENFLPGFKLVRGAYMEKERTRAIRMGYDSPIHPDKASTDAAYNQALEFCIARVNKLAFLAGTHNENSTLLLCRLMEQSHLPADHPHVFFSQLYGMSDHISQNLAAASYRVSKYLPYGALRSVIPYLLRRAAENTSVAGQTGRELFLIRKEIMRRRSRER